MTVFVF